MAVRKNSSLKKKLAPRKPKPTKAPGKPDPKFLDRLSRAVREELEGAGSAAPEDSPAVRTRRTPTRTEATAPVAGAAPARRAGKAAAGASAARTAEPRASRAGAKAPGSGKDRRTALLKELKSVLAELDEEGLDFLLEQAHVHRYNMEVDRLNEAEERREASRSEPRAAGSRQGKGKAPAPRTPPLRIERSQDGETYHVVSAGRYKMFSAQEMLSLVRIAHANPDPAEAGRGLYRWMTRERTDALADLGFAGPSDPGLAALAALIRKSFAAPPKRG